MPVVLVAAELPEAGADIAHQNDQALFPSPSLYIHVPWKNPNLTEVS